MAMMLLGVELETLMRISGLKLSLVKKRKS